MPNFVLCEDVFAVVVSYQPIRAHLEQLLLAVLPQVGNCLIIDNGNLPTLPSWIDDLDLRSIEVLSLESNVGLATAQNIGISKAMAAGATYLLLFDQDSVPAPDMVVKLRDAARELTNQAHDVAVVGPEIEDIGLPDRGASRVVADGCSTFLETGHVIASGSLFPLRSFSLAGRFKDEFFIDYVDIEWAHRARTKGLRSFVVKGARMTHQLGTPAVLFGRSFPLHSPLRRYYQVRNFVCLCKAGYVPTRWKLVEAFFLGRHIIASIFFIEPRTRYLKMAAIGLWHGLTKKMGPLSSQT